MYCKYCGRELKENETCTCQYRSETENEPTVDIGDLLGRQEEEVQPSGGNGEGFRGFLRDSGFSSLKDILPGLLKNQSSALRDAINGGNTNAQLRLADIYLFLWFVLGLTMSLRMRLGAASIGYAFLFAAFGAVYKGALAYGSYLLSDRQYGIRSVVALFGACSVYESIGVILLFIFSLFGILNTYVMLILLLLLVVACGAISGFNAARVVCREGRAQLLVIAVTAVMTILIILIIRPALFTGLANEAGGYIVGRLFGGL